MKDGFLRIAAATPVVKVADCHFNANEMLKQIDACPKDTAVLVFPELSMTGYTCDDLFFQPLLLKAAETELEYMLKKTAKLDTLIMVGVPVELGVDLYNCAAVMQRGKLLGLVPKKNIASHAEFYEGRHFADGEEMPRAITYAGQETLLGMHILFQCEQLPHFTVGVEICEDIWVAEQPSIALAKAGATVIVNQSASSESVGKSLYRQRMVEMQSARLHCAYVFADAGEGESTGSMIFAGDNVIAEGGCVVAKSVPYTTGITAAEIDLERIAYSRRRSTTFRNVDSMQKVSFSYPPKTLELQMPIEKYPFIPQDMETRNKHAEEILTMQSYGLAMRLKHTGANTVIGLSGGLDSALALLVISRAYDRLGLDKKNIHAVTMPCFGTTERTRNNALLLAKSVGATLHEIDITKATRQHLADIGHDEATLDVTYENAQARERTQVLMDLANMHNALVIGTGDMSELALGWATYNGDHMSMYGVNAGVPKTLVRYLVQYEAERLGGDLKTALNDILDTPVSPELLPPTDGVISQQTEKLVGPYALHDFFLYHFMRYGCPPAKIYRLANLAFADEFSAEEIKKWLLVFCRRFFTQQFKRSCLPDGPKVGSVCLSPRSDWKMPSDAVATLWIEEIEKL